jgi:HPt (histidine-containing phosphotransfer) domain-containing protein
MVRSFSQQIPEELNDLKMAIGQKDYGRVKAIAHTMKSTVSFLGLQKLAPLLQQLEKDAENKRDFTEIQNKFELINTICQAAVREAGQLIS